LPAACGPSGRAEVRRLDYEQAKYQLQLHLGVLDKAQNEWVLADGFLVSLRPYRGLQEKNFHLVMEALLTAGERIHREPQVDRDLVRTVWSLCWYARVWGLYPAGMLQRNRLITAADTARLERWVGTLEIVALRLLRGWPPHHAVYHYAEYVVEVGGWDNVAFFVGLMGRAVADPEVSDAIETIAQALGKLGPLAKAALPALREAERREYTWYTPAERCTEEVRAHIRRAIQAVEG